MENERRGALRAVNVHIEATTVAGRERLRGHVITLLMVTLSKCQSEAPDNNDDGPPITDRPTRPRPTQPAS